MSQSIPCSKCLYHHEFYQAPIGKVVRNPEALKYGCTHDTCDACDGTGYIPENILSAIEGAFPNSYAMIKDNVRWSSDHWSFIVAGMYVGVEKDGYIHS